MDLFAEKTSIDAPKSSAPLAARMRPRTIEEIFGQEHLLAPGMLLRRAIDSDRLGSIILYGPPGCGKTSLAEVIAGTTRRRFERASGVLANLAILRDILRMADHRKSNTGMETIVFIDEIHHFNRSQQDILLPHVEDGSITLIGATTHNPFFFINSPLLSRSHIFEMRSLREDALRQLLTLALQDSERGLAAFKTQAEDAALTYLASAAEGDARRALNALELAVLTTSPDQKGVIRLTQETVAESIQKKIILYDRDGDGHYDTISAFIKSIRGSDPHAAVYWLAKMLQAGEDPRFIARRLLIAASEDIGNADPQALILANAAKEAVLFVGMPEARIILAQATTYLACAPKSNASYKALEKAVADIDKGRVLPVPKPLRDTHYRGAEQLGHTGYRYEHDHEGCILDQEYLPTSKTYYFPSNRGYEARQQKYLALCAEIRGRLAGAASTDKPGG